MRTAATVFAYGICVGSSGKFERRCLPSILRFDPEAHIITRRGQSSIFSAYNSILAEASELRGLEGVVLLHDDVELLAPIDGELRQLFQDPRTLIVGAVGGRQFTGALWWQTEQRFGRVTDNKAAYDYGGGRHEVDSIDGLLIAMSGPGVRELRFDDANYTGFHGYDADICAQARAHGGRVMVGQFELFHDAKLGYGNAAALYASECTYRLKWERATLVRRTGWRLLRVWHRQAAKLYSARQRRRG